MTLLGLLMKILPTVGKVYAHCDVPCGIYDPKTAQIAAETVLKMVTLIQELPEHGKSATDKNKLVEEVEKLHPITKEIFNLARNQVMNINLDIYLRAAYYFAINRSSFSGCTLSGGYSAEAASKRFTISSIDRLKKFKVADFDIQCMDFADFIELNDEYDYMYLDPPYYLNVGNNLYGNKGDMHENFDHDKLFNLLQTRQNWVMSYNDCKWVRDKYKDYRIIEAAWSYSMNKTKKSSEVVILSCN